MISICRFNIISAFWLYGFIYVQTFYDSNLESFSVAQRKRWASYLDLFVFLSLIRFDSDQSSVHCSSQRWTEGLKIPPWRKALAKQTGESFIIAPFCIVCRCRLAWLKGKNLWLSVKNHQRFLPEDTKRHSMRIVFVYGTLNTNEKRDTLFPTVGETSEQCIRWKRNTTVL